MKWSGSLEISPVMKERVGGPTTYGFDDIRRNARGEELRCTANAKAVASRAWISRGRPDLIAPREEVAFVSMRGPEGVE